MRNILLLILLTACSPSSMEDFQLEGEAQCRRLVTALKKIETREDLLKNAPQLKKQFNIIVDLMIEARQFQQKHPDELVIDDQGHPCSEELRHELQRIYALEGGRDSMESIERESLLRLDAFEKKNQRKIEQPLKQ